MTFKSNADMFIAQDISVVSATQAHPLGMEITGQDPNLGAGTFVYAQGTGTILAGDVVEITQALAAGILTTKVQQWAGTALTGKTLGVAVGVLTGNLFGWVQIQGNAITNIGGAVAAGDIANFNAAGQLKTAVVASKQVLNCQATAANNATIGTVAIGATKAVYYLNRPFAQGAIT